MKTSKTILFSAVILSTAFLMTADQAEARRKKFKGVIIVNQILKLTGTITDNGNNTPEYSGVKEGDVLETGEKSLAVIRIPGLLILQMGEKTKIKLTRFGNRDKSKIQVFNGEVLFLYKRLGDHEITTPQSLVVPEGAGALTFLVRTSGGGDEISLWDGKMQVKSFAGSAPKQTAIASSESHKIPQLLPEKASDAPKGMNVAVGSGKNLPQTLEISTQKNFKQLNAASEGLEEKSSPAGNLPDLRAIGDLESLYDLP